MKKVGSGSDEKDPLSIKDYTTIFESCENISDAFVSLRSLYDEFTTDNWIRELEKAKRKSVVDFILKYVNKIRENEKTMEQADYVRVIETFCLLENIFRNILIRPYVPAYRSVNMNCGRYRCYINKDAENLFQRLGFEDNDKNILLYTEADTSKTIVYALTCCVFWDYWIQRMEKFLNPPKTNTRRTGQQ